MPASQQRLTTMLLTLILATTIAVISAGPLTDSEELRSLRICKDLCSSCGCLGFYCGDECLCECDGNGAEAEDDGGKCIERMQDRCERQRFPFEVLIQGENGNRLVRSLFANPAAGSADAEEAVCIAKDSAERRKRSTFSIYKPKAEVEAESESAGSDEADMLLRERKISDNAETLRDVQKFLSEIGAELENELMKRDQQEMNMINNHDKRELPRGELQENESYMLHKRGADGEDLDETTAAVESADPPTDEPTVGDAEPDGDADAAAAAAAEEPEATEEAAAADDSNLGVAANSTNFLAVRKQQLAAAMEQLKSRLVTADGSQLAAMQSRRADVKAKMLADLEEKKQRFTQKVAESKQQFEAAKQKNAEFRSILASKFGVPTEDPTATTETVSEPNEEGDAIVGAAAPVVPAGLNALRPALNRLRNLLTPGAAAPAVPVAVAPVAAARPAGLPVGLGAGAPRLLNLPSAVQALSGPERALLQQIKQKAYFDGLSAQATLNKAAFRKKLLAKPVGLGAWAKTLGAGNPGADDDVNVGAAADANAPADEAKEETEATTAAGAVSEVEATTGIVVQPEGLVDE